MAIQAHVTLISVDNITVNLFVLLFLGHISHIFHISSTLASTLGKDERPHLESHSLLPVYKNAELIPVHKNIELRTRRNNVPAQILYQLGLDPALQDRKVNL